MNNTTTSEENHGVLRAVLFALGCIVIGVSYLSIRSSLSIPSFNSIYSGYLGGEPLPDLTLFLFTYQPVFVFIACAIPVCAVATIFIRKLATAFYAMGILALASIVLTMLVYHGLTAPLFVIFSNLTKD